MGSCASIHKATTQETAINRAIHFEAKTDKLLIPESALDDNKHVHVDLSVIKNFDAYNGSKEEAFFDSQPWLESDCEDDFYSVKGDFTPSCGSSPVHHSFPAAPAGNQPSPSMPVPSPTGQKKRLSELFRESRGEDMYQYVADLNAPANKSNTEGKSTLLELPPKSPEDTPYISGTKSVCSSERTPNGNPLFEREKSVKSTQCCLPSLISYRSFRERKKMSPAVAINGKA